MSVLILLFKDYRHIISEIKRFSLINVKYWYMMEWIKSHESEGDHDNEYCIVKVLYRTKGNEFNSICKVIRC